MKENTKRFIAALLATTTIFTVSACSSKKEDTMDEEKTINSDVANRYFNVKFLNKLFNEHLSGKKDNYRKIWTVYTFIKWYQVFFENE